MADAQETRGDATPGDEEAGQADAQEEGALEAAVPQPPAPADLHAVLREPSIRLLSWISLVSAKGAFPSSKATRELLSSRISVEVVFDVYTREESKESAVVAAAARSSSKSSPSQVTPSNDLAQRRRRAQRTRARLPYTAAEGPLRVYAKFAIGEVPVRGAVVNRTLGRNIPMIKWTDIGEIRVKCNGQIPSVDTLLRGKIISLAEADELEFLENPSIFRNVERLTLNINTVACMQPDFCLPKVRRLKLVCRDSAFSSQMLMAVQHAFPRLERLHLAITPAGLMPLCGPGFSAPPDFRISFLDEVGRPVLTLEDRKASFFVASHLMTLPFSWSGSLFQNVTRLQMTELSQDHDGLAIDQLTAIIRSMPHLRRLGTVSMRTFQLIDLAREDCYLEELVIVMNMLDVTPLFRTFLAVEQGKRRTTLRRLAVHMQAGDGVGRPTVEVENSMCGGWNVIATALMRPDGFVCFSFGHPQMPQTALAQLAWFDPKHFSIDWTDYEEDRRFPGSTSLQRPLPYYSTEEVVRPRGTLVAGSLRPANEEGGVMMAETAQPAFNTPQGTGRRKSASGRSLTVPSLSSGGTAVSRTPSGSPSPGGRRRQSFCRLGSSIEFPAPAPIRHAFMDVTLIDAYETMMRLKQEDRL